MEDHDGDKGEDAQPPDVEFEKLCYECPVSAVAHSTLSSLHSGHGDRAAHNDDTTRTSALLLDKRSSSNYQPVCSSDVVVIVALVALVYGLCEPLSAMCSQHPSLDRERFEDYSTYLLGPGIWAVMGVVGV